MNQTVIQAVAETLTPISGIMLSPIPLAGLIVVLASNGGRIKSIVFSAGFFCSLWLSTFIAAWSAHKSHGYFHESDVTSIWSAVGQGVLGGLLLIFSLRNFFKWSKDRSSTKEPKWMKRIDSASILTIFTMAVTMVLVNPKNLPLVISAGIDYARADLTTAQLSFVVTVFAFLGALLAFMLIVLEFTAPKTAAKHLEEMRPWLISKNKLILAVIFFIMGFNLLEKAFQT